MLREIREQPEILRRLYTVNAETYAALTKELKERGITKCVLTGRGTSDHAAIYAQYMLGSYCGVVSALAIPSSLSAYGAKMHFEDCLVVGISQSGQAADAHFVLKQAKEQNAVTLAITNNLDSPMARDAEYHLYCDSGVEKSIAATKTFTAQMYLLGCLAAEWSENDTLRAALRNVYKDVEKLLAKEPNGFKSMVDCFRFVNDGFVLSRGFNYPIALECGLKLNETCYAKIKGYAVSDFYHGPMAQLDMQTPVVVFSPRGELFDNILELIQKLYTQNIQVSVVTDDEILAQQYPESILLPCTGCEATSPFVFAAFVQSFAQALSVSRGLNPDSPRMLKKVTITL